MRPYVCEVWGFRRMIAGMDGGWDVVVVGRRSNDRSVIGVIGMGIPPLGSSPFMWRLEPRFQVKGAVNFALGNVCSVVMVLDRLNQRELYLYSMPLSISCSHTHLIMVLLFTN